MLKVTRRDGESVIIGDDVVVRVERIMGSKVLLAIDAPKTVCVDRQEVRLQRQAREAAEAAAAPAAGGDPCH